MMNRFVWSAVCLGVAAAALVPTGVDAQTEEDDLTDAFLTVTPAADLVDFQTVTVSAENYNPVGSTLYVAQCASGVTGSISISDCDQSNLGITVVGDDESASVDLRVRREISTAGSGVIDCAVVDACVIGAATLESNLVTVVEAFVVPIAFDPDVPAAPRLEIDVEVVSADAMSFTASVTCNREADAYLNGNLTQQTNKTTASSFGYRDGTVPCGPTPRSVVVPLAPSTGKYKPGTASLSVFADAFDGSESSFDTAEFEVQLSGNANKVEPISAPGEFLSVEIVGHSGSGDAQFIDVEVTCSVLFEFGYISLDVSQYAGRDLVRANGYADIENCDGATAVSVPLSGGYDGVIVGGPARVGVMVYGYGETSDGTFVNDGAAAVDLVRLRGRVPVQSPDVEFFDGTYVTIESRTVDSISGTVECAEPATVQLDVNAFQARGRTSNISWGFQSIACDGTTPFEIPIFGDVKQGTAVIMLYAYAYREVQEPDFPYPTFEYIWDDVVVEAARLSK